MARKFDYQRAVDLYLAHQVRKDLTLSQTTDRRLQIEKRLEMTIPNLMKMAEGSQNG